MILYAGNMLYRQRGYYSQDELNARALSAHFEVKQLGRASSQWQRLLQILLGIIRYRNRARLMLIGTFSTRAFWFAWLASRLCVLFRIPYIPVVHGGNLPEKMKADPVRTGKYFRQAAHVITPSRYLENWLLNQQLHCTYLPNMLQTGLYPFTERQTLQPKILWVRSFMPIYQPLEALKAFQLLLQQYPAARLTMVGGGDPELLHSCQEWAQQQLPENAVHFTGKLSREAWTKLAPAHDIFLNSAAIDNQPVSVLEAMALALCVVSSNAGGMPWLLRQGALGWLATGTTADPLYEAMVNALKQQENSLQKIREAYTEVNQFQWEVQEPQWLQLIRQYQKP